MKGTISERIRKRGAVTEYSTGDPLCAQAADIIDALEMALAGIQWKSADRDNMEFAARITCFQMDAIRAALAKARKGG